MCLRRTIRIRKKDAIGEEGPKVNLLSARDKDSQRSGNHTSRTDGAALVSNANCACFANDM
jgi:hypothetical protein